MRAIAITPGKGNPKLIEVDEQKITKSKDVKLRIIEIGICGTDKEEVHGGRADAPIGTDKLIIGHEMLGRVVEVGADVKGLNIGDYAIFTVRRECGECLPCGLHRSDMCYSGKYKERGIKELHGFQQQFIVDDEKYLVKLPDEIKHIAVLTEPMSIAEKAIDEAVTLQASRLPGFNKETWAKDSRILIAGIGSVGLLAAFILSLKGAKVFGLDIVEDNSIRPTILKALGGTYINANDISPKNIYDKCGKMDFIFEDAGIPKLSFELLDALNINAIYVLTGIPGGTSCTKISGAELLRKMVLNNQIMLGSVNASQKHFQMAIEDLKKANNLFPEVIAKMITNRIPVQNYDKAFQLVDPQDIKVVINWEDDIL